MASNATIDVVDELPANIKAFNFAVVKISAALFTAFPHTHELTPWGLTGDAFWAALQNRLSIRGGLAAPVFDDAVRRALSTRESYAGGRR